jgi:hypothetical protein
MGQLGIDAGLLSPKLLQTVRAVREREGRSPALSLNAERESDVGYHLIAKGRPLLEKNLHCRVSFRDRVFREHNSRAALAYVGSIVIVTAS